MRQDVPEQHQTPESEPTGRGLAHKPQDGDGTDAPREPVGPDTSAAANVDGESARTHAPHRSAAEPAAHRSVGSTARRSLTGRALRFAAHHPIAFLAAALAMAVGARLADLEMRQGPGTAMDVPDPNATENPKPDPSTVARPLRIEIDGSTFRVGGKPVELRAIKTLVGHIPDGDGPDVKVNRLGTSRAAAENELKELLRQCGAKAVWWPPE
jgi:hypothetical protein